MSFSDAPPKTPPAHRRAIAAASEVRAPSVTRDAPAVELRLAIGKNGLGLELARPARVACVDVTELTVTLPGARFPIDVSGGVARFRHKRGCLERIALEVGARGLETWAAPRLRGLLGPAWPRVSIAVRHAGATVSVSEETASGARVLAFDVVLGARADDVSLAIMNARGVGLPRPPTGLAIAAMESLLGSDAARGGCLFLVRGLGSRLARALLPDAGARSPSAEGLVVTALTAHDTTWILHASRGGLPLDATEASARALEAATLTRDADEARLAGQLDRARALDLAALERAPRHPEICRRIAEIDAHAGGRAEAAISTLREASPGSLPGVLMGELLAETGDTRGAIAALARAGEEETAPLLGAQAYARAAELTADPLDALIWLDLAITRAPNAAALRWARVARRLASGRMEDAIGDVQHLEALASGAREKYAVWRRAGDAWKEAALAREATALYERALLYAPDDPAALAGLGAALIADGRASRGAALLARAIDLADSKSPRKARESAPEAPRHSSSAMLLDLANALAEALGDKPAAIARARAVGNDAPEALAARGLEGRWRAELGDLAGGSLAFAKMRDLAESSAATKQTAKNALPLLVEAATFEDRVQGDLLASQRHLAMALRLDPKDPTVKSAYRAVGARIAQRPEAAPTDDPGRDDGNDEARVEELTRALQANPEDDSVVDELATRLSRLGRSLELFALLSARLEDAPQGRRERLVPRQRTVLQRLENEARHAGRSAEADLFAEALTALR